MSTVVSSDLRHIFHMRVHITSAVIGLQNFGSKHNILKPNILSGPVGVLLLSRTSVSNRKYEIQSDVNPVFRFEFKFHLVGSPIPIDD